MQYIIWILTALFILPFVIAIICALLAGIIDYIGNKHDTRRKKS